MSITFGELRSSLSACHLDAKNRVHQVLLQQNKEYLLSRAQEALLYASEGIDVDKNLIFVIQLCNIARKKCEDAKPQLPNGTTIA
jgi:hypothetical protein